MKPLYKLLTILILLSGSMVCKANEEEKAEEYFNCFKTKYSRILGEISPDSAYQAICKVLDYDSLHKIINEFVSPDNPSLKKLPENKVFKLNNAEVELLDFLNNLCGLNINFSNRGYFFAPDLKVIKLLNINYISPELFNAYRYYKALANIYFPASNQEYFRKKCTEFENQTFKTNPKDFDRVSNICDDFDLEEGNLINKHINELRIGVLKVEYDCETS